MSKVVAKPSDQELNDRLEQMKLRQKYVSLVELDEKLNQTVKDNRILQLTLQEIREIEGEAKFYESHGRAYVRNFKKEVINNLESMSNAKQETIENLKKNRDKRAAELQIKNWSEHYIDHTHTATDLLVQFRLKRERTMIESDVFWCMCLNQNLSYGDNSVLIVLLKFWF